jgi:hypothetical protein
MDTIILERFAWSDDGVFGKMQIDGIDLFTVEKPWRDNKAGISCIPAGKYICRPRRYYRGGYETFEITDVEKRSYILIHKGNTQRDVRGCIAVGMDTGYINGAWAVINSAGAFWHFMNAQRGLKGFELIIRNIV